MSNYVEIVIKVNSYVHFTDMHPVKLNSDILPSIYCTNIGHCKSLVFNTVSKVILEYW